MKKINTNNITLLLLVTLLILSIINYNIVTEEILKYLKIFIERLFPSTFIILTIGTLIINNNLLEKILNKTNKNISQIYIFIMSIISGFPSGSKYIKELLNKELITEKQANNLIKSTHFPNPIFILNTSNIIFNSNKYPIKILISIILSNLIIFIIYYKKESINKKIKTKNVSFINNLTKSINSTIKTLIIIFGTNTLFIIIFKLLTKYLKINIYLYILLNGLFDLTDGIYKTVLIKNNILKSIYIILFTSLGSIPIHFQVQSILENTNVSNKNYLSGRILGTILSIIIFLILTK